MMTRINVFVDPACPWAWITSRWLAEVAPERDLEIRWRALSLEIRDGGVRLPAAIPEHLRPALLARGRIGAVALRVFELLRMRVGEEAVGRFYAELGYRLNDPGSVGALPSGTVIGCSLAAAGLDPTLEIAAGEALWQSRVELSTNQAMAVVGSAAMTPVIVLDGNPPRGLSGPIVSPAPTGTDALRLWDAIMVLIESRSFIEARRGRSLPDFPRRPDSNAAAMGRTD